HHRLPHAQPLPGYQPGHRRRLRCENQPPVSHAHLDGHSPNRYGHQDPYPDRHPHPHLHAHRNPAARLRPLLEGGTPPAQRTARGPDEAWVTGHWETGNDYNPYIIYHFSSGRWVDMGAHTKQGRPEGATLFYAYLTDVAAVGPGEMWAVGYQTCYGCAPWQQG